MSLARAEQKEKAVREAVLNLLAYYAIWGVRLDFPTLYSYLQVKAGELMVKKQLESLVKQGKVTMVDGRYGLKKQRYPSSDERNLHQQKLLKKAKRWGRVMGLIPFVKSVVVICSVAVGNSHEESDIDLLIVTSPNRIFITKGILMYGLKILRQLEDQYHRAGRLNLSLFITTKGINSEKDVMKVNEPHLVYYLITGIPVYGAMAWHGIMKNDNYVSSKLPNYIWPKHDGRIFGNGWQWLDRLDSYGYRKHLRHTAAQARTHHPGAFIRIRPDIIGLHHKGTSAEVAEKWLKIRTSI